MSRLSVFLIILTLSGCHMKKEKADLLVKDARIYTVDASFSIVEAFVVKDGRILETGSSANLEKKYRPESILSLRDLFVYPGWIDAHAHFIGYGLSLNQVDLVGTKSIGDVLNRADKYAKDHPGSIITGRGWDQNDWLIKEFPDKYDLDGKFPDTPVLFRRIDGHAGWANSKALELAGITKSTIIEGGEVQIKNGEVSGILLDNAIDLVLNKLPLAGRDELVAGILKAEQNCFAVGLTSVSDAGLPTDQVLLIDSLQQNGLLKMRINAWLNPSERNFTHYIENGPFHNDYLNIGTLKLYADGALGSRGARMLEEYADDPGNYGLFVTDPEKLREYCHRAYVNNFQVATHCIGDAANRLVLEIYSDLLSEGNDKRWRIEHAQIIHPDDFKKYGRFNIIPSVQPTHATSDMYWASERIGKERMKGAYSYKTLLNQNGWIPNGSDFPVEDINPLYGFFAAVARTDKSGFPEGGFRSEEALTREEALKAMTIWAAKAGFEEEYKGSIEAGKLADFVVTEEDIMTTDEMNIPNIQVFRTYSGGKLVFQKEMKTSGK